MHINDRNHINEYEYLVCYSRLCKRGKREQKIKKNIGLSLKMILRCLDKFGILNKGEFIIITWLNLYKKF